MSLTDQRNSAEAFAELYLPSLCSELLECSATGIYPPNGRFLELTRLCNYANEYRQGVATTIIKELALQFVVEHTQIDITG